MSEKIYTSLDRPRANLPGLIDNPGIPLKLDGRGMPLKTIENFYIAMEWDYSMHNVRFNELTGAAEIAEYPTLKTETVRRWTDTDTAQLEQLLESDYGLYGPQKFHSARSMRARRSAARRFSSAGWRRSRSIRRSSFPPWRTRPCLTPFGRHRRAPRRRTGAWARLKTMCARSRRITISASARSREMPFFSAMTPLATRPRRRAARSRRFWTICRVWNGQGSIGLSTTVDSVPGGVQTPYRRKALIYKGFLLVSTQGTLK